MPLRRYIPIFAILVLVAAGAPVRAADDPIVATVNGVEIHMSDVEEAALVLPDQYRQLPMDTLFPYLVERLVRMYLLADEGVRQGLDQSEAYTQRLERAGRRILEQATVDEMLTERLDEASLRARYDRFVAERGDEQEVHARHILLADLAAAEQVIRDLDGGANFEELAKERSTGPSGPTGGDLGYFRKGQMVPPFEEAAFGMALGSHSAVPVQTQFGWHVIKVEDKRAVPVPPFEAVAEQLRVELARELEDEYVASLRAAADVQILTSNAETAQ